MKTINLFCSILLLALAMGCKQQDSKKVSAGNLNDPQLEKFIGQPFSMKGFMDTLGNVTDIDLKKTPLTIIDIWMDQCPSCVSDMNQFAGLLKGKEEKISVISISINTLWGWKKMMPGHPERYGFLKSSAPNWKQLIFTSTQIPELHNDIAPDRADEIVQKWGTNSYPIYFVVNKDGIIQAVPMSAAAYLESM